jgi:hypothetical protein
MYFCIVIDERPITDWLPITKKEAEKRGWNELDVILISGDAYVDHPAFGTAVVGRIIESEGFKIGIVAQPNWKDDLRDFKKFGTPKYFFCGLPTLTRQADKQVFDPIMQQQPIQKY